MQIKINGEIQSFPNEITVCELLTYYALDTRKVAVECNLEIVSKSAYKSFILADGDQLEIVHFIGGG